MTNVRAVLLEDHPQIYCVMPTAFELVQVLFNFMYCFRASSPSGLDLGDQFPRDYRQISGDTISSGRELVSGLRDVYNVLTSSEHTLRLSNFPDYAIHPFARLRKDMDSIYLTQKHRGYSAWN
ncbi:hypothetical protein C8R44DRAFT_751358 [Mycena epipterygia]|nr:hypothetical protein C8R44DRAFT_751358 [Mycena epipterygia]